MDRTEQQLREEIWELKSRMAKSHSNDDIVCYVVWTAMVVGGMLGAFLTG